MSKLKRRHFLLGAVGITGALVVGWAAAPLKQRLVGKAPLPIEDGQAALNGWVKVNADNTVTMQMAATEMGQGIFTGLAMLLADEMDADLAQIRIEQAGTDPIDTNQAMLIEGLPFFPDDAGALKRGVRHVMARVLREVPGFWGSGGSSAVVDQWQVLREAGASARAMLVGAASAQWNVPVGECIVDAGRVSHAASQRSATFGELAVAAGKQALPAQVTLKTSAQFKLIGKPVHRLEGDAKLHGTATFGIDVLPEGLLYASLRMCPTVGGRVARFDAKAAEALPGVRRVVLLEPNSALLVAAGDRSGGVAVIADTPFHAQRALDKIDIEWDHGNAVGYSSAGWLDMLAQAAVEDKGHAHREVGDAKKAIAGAAKVIEAEYRAPYLAHATMEPMNCTVQFKDGAATVWVGAQFPAMAQSAAAKVLGIDAAKVEVNLTYLGGGFGRRAATDIVTQAAALARETNGAPVQLLWSREEDMRQDYYRPAFAARAQAGLDAQGKLVGWRMDTAGSSLGAPDLMSAATEGTSTIAYAFPSARITHKTMECAVPVGFWRSVNHSQNAFFTESFIDECAHAAGQDPVLFRSALLAGNARHMTVLQRLAELSLWGTPPAPGADGTERARGIALHRSFGSLVGQVAEVSISPDKVIRVHRVTCVVDCGFVVNPNLVRQQMEGGIIFGLTAALHGEVTLEKGQVKQSNFHDYRMLLMNDCPAIEIDIIASAEPPGGVGEPGTPPIAPAVANAVFALTKQRLRTLPLKLAA